MGILIGYFLAGLLAAWVYRDARSRGAEQAGLWALGTFLLAIVVVPVWLVKRPAKGAASLRPCPHCAEQIQLAAAICRFCHRDVPLGLTVPSLPRTRAFSTGFKVALATFGVLMALVVVAAFVTADAPSSAARTEMSTDITPSSVGAPRKSGLSKANYLRISEGMTYREVVAILGEPGEEMSRSDIAGITTVMYGWKRWNGANMNAMFQNDALVTKAQFGLK
jgi:hypothetical protein